jgi:hypothetical protein
VGLLKVVIGKAQLRRHLVHITAVQRQFLRNLLIRDIQLTVRPFLRWFRRNSAKPCIER